MSGHAASAKRRVTFFNLKTIVHIDVWRAVLTRLPSPHRLAPGDAGALVQDFVRGTKFVALPAAAYAALVRRLAGEGSAVDASTTRSSRRVPGVAVRRRS
jgi:hypothetical protein